MNQLTFLQSLGWALVNSLWQMALLWAIYQLITVSFQKLRASKRTSLAILLTFSGFGWFIYTLADSLLSNANSTNSFYTPGIINDDTWNYFEGKILPYASVVYLVILAAPLWQFIRNYRFVQFIRTSGLKKIEVDWRMYVKRTAAAMGITREVKIWLSEWVTSPVTIGYLKPIILIPVAAVNNLTPHQVEAVILHELSHIHRYDYFLNLMVSLIRTVLYFNPFVKLLVKSIEKEREHSCDEMVLQFQYKPGEYASALLRLEQTKQRQMVMAAAGKNADLLHRIESILGMRNKGWNPLRQLSFAVLAMLGIVLFHFLVSVNYKGTAKKLYSLSSEVSPYYFLNGKPVRINNNFVVKNSSAKQSKRITAEMPGPEIELVFDGPTEDAIVPPAFMHVNFTSPVIPELAPEEEEKVKGAVDATKKILQESEWKAVEKKYAEVLNTAEKYKLKSEYKYHADNVNWNNLENQLRLAYTEINWDNVNEKINTSLAQIKSDSIQTQLSLSLKALLNLEKVMKDNNVSAIPDTEICLQTVKEYQQKTREQLNVLKATRTKKIVRL
ncbi:MAG TPA: M56 family metallopeptidase [Chitinophagaceae bacterium]|nr:M56 family metallopeptidase [Chitinophagaceae bacterium]